LNLIPVLGGTKCLFDMHSNGRIIYAFMCVKYSIYLPTLSFEDEP